MEVIFPTTGDRIVDALVTYSLTDLISLADKKAKFKWAIGYDNPLQVELFKVDALEMTKSALNREVKKAKTAENLNFMLNVGNIKWMVDPEACNYCGGKRECGRNGKCGKVVVPAYAVLFKALKDVSELRWPPYPFTKGGVNLATVYMGLSPFWSKGLRRWDSIWEGVSTYAPPQLQVLLIYGISCYTINTIVRAGNQNQNLMMLLSPPSTLSLNHDEALLFLQSIKRFMSFRWSLQRTFSTPLPTKVMPLVLLSQLDLPLVNMISNTGASLIFTMYDMDRGCPKNPRGHEELSMVEVADFCISLREHLWDFKMMIDDLLGKLRDPQLKARVEEMLIGLACAISTHNPWLMNDTLLKIRFLADEARLHCLNKKAVLAAHRLLLK